jgi:hypothetical protein
MMQEMTTKTTTDKTGKRKQVIVYADTEETQYQRIQRLRKQYE